MFNRQHEEEYEQAMLGLKRAWEAYKPAFVERGKAYLIGSESERLDIAEKRYEAAKKKLFPQRRA